MPFDTFVLGTSPGSGVGGGSTQDLWETIAADAGSEIATSPTETLTVTGGVGISTSVAGTTLTITNSSPNVDQNLWETITADSGSTLASTPTDSLSVVGGTDISTVLVGDVLTINFTGTSGGGGTEDAYSHIHDNVGGIASAIGHDVVTFTGIGITITAVNGAAGDDEIFFEVAGGLGVSPIDGEDVPTFEDTTRGKTLSVETATITWGKNGLKPNDYFKLGDANNADTGFVVPHTATLVKVSGVTADNQGNARGIDMYVNGVLNTASILSFTGIPPGQEIDRDVTINIDLAQDDIVHLRGDASAGDIKGVAATLFFKWRL